MQVSDMSCQTEPLSYTALLLSSVPIQLSPRQREEVPDPHENSSTQAPDSAFVETTPGESAFPPPPDQSETHASPILPENSTEFPTDGDEKKKNGPRKESAFLTSPDPEDELSDGALSDPGVNDEAFGGNDAGGHPQRQTAHNPQGGRRDRAALVPS